MTKADIEWLKKTRHLLPDNLGKVLEVGSLNVNGSAREVYKEYDVYIGTDMRKGKDVDIVVNGHDLEREFNIDSFDTVVCMNTMEHDNKFWLTLERIKDVLRRGGYFVFTIPAFHYPSHSHPQDYWRMSPKAVEEVIMEGYEIIDFDTRKLKSIYSDKYFPYLISAIGKKL